MNPTLNTSPIPAAAPEVQTAAGAQGAPTSVAIGPADAARLRRAARTRRDPLMNVSWAVLGGYVAASGLLIAAASGATGAWFHATATELALAGTGLGAVGLAALSALSRRRVRGPVAVASALASRAQGEPAGEGLLVAEHFGPEAQRWNQIVAELAGLSAQLSAVQAGERRSASGTPVSRGESDLTGVCDAWWHGLLLIDERERVRYANGAAGVMLNQSREAMLSAGAADVLAGESGRAVLEAVRAATSGAVRSRQSVEMRRAGTGNGAAGVYRVTVRPLRQADAGPMTMVVLEDVTQQRVADESRGLFVTQATHELRQPLTNMRLYIEELIDADASGAHDPKERARCLNVISGEARRLERIVTDMLSVSEIEAGSLSLRRDDIPLEPMFKELADDFAAAASDKQIALSVELPPKLPGGGVIRGDRDKLGLVLHNLVGNAIKYTPKGGKVIVRVRDDAGADAGRFVVDVVDNGIGIKPDEHELIFERFYRAKDRRIASVTGSGLGLALARQIARLHKGDVTIASQIDKGSTFTLSVPIVEDAAVGGAGESSRRAA